jgi:hypothetical protein
MPRPKRLPTLGIRLLNGHVGITKTNDLFFAVLTSLYNRLLTARNLALWLVAFHLGLVDLSHNYSTITDMVVLLGIEA